MKYVKENPDTVTLHQRDSQVYDGVTGAADMTPGIAVEATGLDEQYPVLEPHSGGSCTSLKVLKEYSHTGGSIDEDYVEETHAEYRHAVSGERYYMFLDDGESVDPFDELVLADNGTFAAQDTEECYVAEALEAVDNELGGEPVRIQVEVK